MRTNSIAASFCSPFNRREIKMSFRRSLVDCTVLFPQDACVFYPCCRGCFTRMDVKTRDTTRYICLKCGYSCLKEQLQYRYRLSLRVTRDRRIFGVTVFGSSLNPFFGIHATEFQRLVENLDGPSEASIRSKLLAKAVEDSFVGRRLVFGIKVTNSQSCPWSEDHVPSGSGPKDMAQFTATQMISPKAIGLEGCSVISYYRILLRRTVEQRVSTDPNKSCTISSTPLIPQDSPASSFSHVMLSHLVSHPLPRSQYHDSTLTPTPPWQQSLGLVTSSAEQEQEVDRSTCDVNEQTVGPVERGCDVNCNTKEEKKSSFAEYSSVRNVLNCLNSSTPPWLSSEQKVSLQLNDSTTSSSLVWEDLPFSESLEQFLSEEDKYFNTETPLSAKCSSVHLRDTKTSVGRSRVLADINDKSVQSHGGDTDEELGDDYNCSQDLFSFNSEKAQPNLKHLYVQKIIQKGQKTPAENTCNPILDFIPCSQSTPIVKRDPSSSSSPTRICSKKPSRKHYRIPTTPKTHKRDSSVWNMPLSHLEYSEVIVPPTPAATHVKADCSPDKTSPQGRYCKRILLGPTLAWSQGGGSIERAAIGSPAQEEACDWSRDLFSDSV
ncbi:DNA damage-induced apoptosis suppressor protein isoform X1 [Entelurus aequoreus]|uniref:DNA damage-induced apoptosis suppressor protein isoform X1 n=2 Tax=Entelurus aequoreus TaxID=161455 RepID=UPI002B1DE57D|nr:DNA damage-induced apoptosis suppressor protein isoform X1 [Entelurus aequoreus]